MNAHDRKLLQISAIFIIAILVSFVVLNRWLFTDIGFLSFGRVWHFYISYEDFGFIRRALVGTLLSVTGLNSIIQNEYHFALIAQHICILMLATILLYYVLIQGINDIATVATIALSPALIIQSGYTNGSLDIFVLIIASINILYTRSLLIFTLIIIIGILLHELFIFTIPAQLVSRYFHIRQQRGARLFCTDVFAMALVSITIIFILTFGGSSLPKDNFESIMASRIPLAAHQHELWSGYFEINTPTSSDTSDYLYNLIENILLNYIYLILPILYTSLVIMQLLSFSLSKLEKLLLSTSTLFPLLVSLVATDLYRWIGVSAGLGLILTLSFLGKHAPPKSGFTYVLLPFSLLAPFGAAQIDRPFPLHQFVLERFFF